MSTWIALMLLTGGAFGQQTAVKDDVEKVSDPQDRVVCKRFVDTGSLVRGSRVCKTKRDWESDRARIRANAGPGVDSCSARANGGSC